MRNWLAELGSKIASALVETSPDPTPELLDQASKDLLSDDPEAQARGRRTRDNLGRVHKASGDAK